MIAEHGKDKIMKRIKIAAGSDDGKIINQHFGFAEQFAIFEWEPENDRHRFLEFRKTERACNLGSHDEKKLVSTIRLLNDCAVVLVSNIGEGAQQITQANGLQVLKIGGRVDDALKKLKESKYLKKQLNTERSVGI